jgi:3-(3-hydroxy-phenyl)propionate hydroxylase
MGAMNAPAHELERIGPFVYRRHAARRERGDTRHRVVVVGGGPVGLAVALGLARFGVESLVVEADDTVCMGSRACCISRRSLEIVDRLGALDGFMAKGMPWTGGRSFYRNAEVFRFSMPQDDRQRLPPMINLQQYYIEDELLRVADPETVDVRWATRVTAIDVRADGATLSLENEHGAYSVHADWVVACDGGQSLVRKSLGLALEGTAYEGRYVIIDIELPSEHPAERRAWFDPPWNPGSTVLMHRQPDDIWRIDYQLRHGESTEEALRPENVHAFVQRHLDAIGEGHLQWKPVWTSIYRAGAMTLASYRHGRVLFAGNAAHAMPIFGVRGLNSGFDDADNLAWKLALTIRGEAGERLLDSYSDERVHAFHVNAAFAMRSTEFMSPPSRGFDLMREAALSLSEKSADIAKLMNPRQTSAIAYERSPLSTPDRPGEFACGPAPGAVLPELPVGGAYGHLTRVVGPWFTLLAFGGEHRAQDLVSREHGVRFVPVLRSADARRADASVDGKIDAPVDTDVPGKAEAVVDANGALAAAFGARDGAAYLLRPDGHVAARWQSPTAELVHAALLRARGLEEIPR